MPSAASNAADASMTRSVFAPGVDGAIRRLYARACCSWIRSSPLNTAARSAMWRASTRAISRMTGERACHRIRVSPTAVMPNTSTSTANMEKVGVSFGSKARAGWVAARVNAARNRTPRA